MTINSGRSPFRRRFSAAMVATVLVAGAAMAADPPDLTAFRTVETAEKVQITTVGGSASSRQPGYVGMLLSRDSRGRLIVGEVASGSPASTAGLQPGDEIRKVAGKPLDGPDSLRTTILGAQPGTQLLIQARRKGKTLDVAVNVAPVSRPLTLARQRPIIGVQLDEEMAKKGLIIRQVTPGSPAESAGLKTGDLIVKVGDVPVESQERYSEAINGRQSGERVVLRYVRDGKEQEAAVTLQAPIVDDARSLAAGIGGGYWRKDTYRLAVIGIEYPDVKHNGKVERKDWEEMFFSRDTYTGKNSATGQPVYGSLADFYHENSCGALKVVGKMFDWIQVSKPRADYSQGSGTGPNSRSLLTEALDVLVAREGKDALADTDGVMFIYAGDRFRTNRGGLYWPHRSSVSYQGKRWPYFICQEGGSVMNNISVFCHEFGHMLGLPDLYARPESPGSEGLGNWCLMSQQLGAGRPQHMSAWCKEQLGWLKPTVIDPTVPQKLVLSPILGSTRECYKVLIRKDGREYLLLENRRKSGFDANMPAEGLLIWHVVGNRPILEESHGIEGPEGPGAFADSVPFPSKSNDSFTPYTTPSSRSQIGGGLPVHITNIQKHPDGRVTFWVGYQFD